WGGTLATGRDVGTLPTCRHRTCKRFEPVRNAINMKSFIRKILICLIPNLIALLVVGDALKKYPDREGGFKLGVDLAGGTILVYEIDPSKQRESAAVTDPTQVKDERLLATYLKRRIDPNDLYNIVIRMVGTNRVEIILPTGGEHRTAVA